MALAAVRGSRHTGGIALGRGEGAKKSPSPLRLCRRCASTRAMGVRRSATSQRAFGEDDQRLGGGGHRCNFARRSGIPAWSRGLGEGRTGECCQKGGEFVQISWSICGSCSISTAPLSHGIATEFKDC